MERGQYPVAEELQQFLEDSKASLEKLLKLDQEVKRRDTADLVIQTLTQIQTAMKNVMEQNQKVQETSYWALLNATVDIYHYCCLLRKSNYGKESSKFLAWCMMVMENNVVLCATKHLNWRVRLYSELAETYEELGAFKAASKVVAHGLKQVQELKEVEECEPPLPEVTLYTLQSATNQLKALDMKYGLLQGTLMPDQWKKRLEEFPNKEDKIKAAFKCLNLVKGRTIQQTGNSVNWKTLVTTYTVDLVSQDIQTVCKALEEISQKRKRDSYYSQVSSDHSESPEEVLNRNREADSQMTKETVWKKASESASLETHLELLSFCYDCKLWDFFYNLSEWAETRLKYRRIEAPLVTDLNLITSKLPDSKIPKGYDKIDVDLNIAHLKQEYTRLGIQQKEEKKVDPKTKAKTPPLKTEEPVVTPSVEHTYVYLLVKRSETEEQALCSLDVWFSQPKQGIAIPIQTFKNTGSTPFAVFGKDSQPGKQITDVKPLIAKHPDAQPPLDYHKVPLDLRQTPSEEERRPNNTYVYLCYKNEEKLVSLERNYRVMKALRRLEQDKAKEKEPDEFGISWQVSLLTEITDELFKATSGPLGVVYANNFPDDLLDTCLKLWDEFVLPVLKNKEIAFERFKNAETDHQVAEKWNEVKESLAECMKTILSVLTTKVKFEDIITLLHIGLSLSKVQEEAQNYRYSIQTLRMILEKLHQYKEKSYKRGISAKNDKVLESSVSCDLELLLQLREEIHSEALNWEHLTAKSLREVVRKKKLDNEEAQEEEWEVLTKTKEKEKLTQEKAQRKTRKIVTEFEIELNNLHTEVLANLFRVELKLDYSKRTEYTQVRNTFSGKKLDTGGLSSGLTAKLKLGKGKTATQIRKNATDLKQTLQESGIVPPNRPPPSKVEKMLIAENGKNPYTLGLLYMQMAAFKSNKQEQKSLLKESLKYLAEAENLEKQMATHAVQSAPEVLAARLFDYRKKDNHHNHYPFKHLADNLLVPPRNFPSKPSIVSRTMNTITLKLPFFNPKIHDKFNIPKVAWLSLYGKETKSGTNVSLTSKEFKGLGEKHLIDEVITIEGLTPYQTYHFATAAFTEEGECIGGIGETGEEVHTLFPLPIPVLYSYIAQNAFKLGHNFIALKAIEKVMNHYLEPNCGNYILQSSLCLKKVYASSSAELRHFTKALLVYVECLIQADRHKEKMKLLRDPLYKPLLVLDKQQKEQKLSNLLVLALEVAVSTSNYFYLKTTLHQVYSLLHKQLPLHPEALLQVLFKAYLSLQIVPNNIWDSEFRKLACLVSKEFFTMFLTTGEYSLVSSVKPKLPIVCFDSEKLDLVSLSFLEFTLQHPELQEPSKHILEHFKEATGQLPEEKKQQQRKALEDLNELWLGVKTTQDFGFSKLNKDNPKYFEFVCKVLWTMVDKGVPLETILQFAGQVTVPNLSQIEQETQTLFEQLENDQPEFSLEEEVPDSHLLHWGCEWHLLQAILAYMQNCSPKKEEKRGSFFVKYIDVGELIKEKEEQEPTELEQLITGLVKASKCSLKSKNYSQQNNCAKWLWNVLNSVLPSPSGTLQDNSWKLIVALALDVLELISNFKGAKDSVVQIQTGTITESSAFEEEESEVAWFLTTEIDMTLYANLVSFAIQILLVAEKWEFLQYVCRKMNSLTQSYYASQILPFQIYSEKALYERAQSIRLEAEKNLQERTTAYETWKATSKKRKSRQALITGEVPQEELDFQRDHQEISESIKNSKAKESELLSQLQSSEAGLSEIKKGESNAYESLMQSRKLLEQYLTEARSLQVESQDSAAKVKKRAHKVFANMVLSTYRKTVELLRKRQEKWFLAQALNELGGLCFSEGLMEEAETSWSDSVDTIFQNLYTIDNFMDYFELETESQWKTEVNLAQKYGLKEVLLGGIVLWKLASVCYETNQLEKHKKCLLLGRLLLSAPFRLSLPHPQNLIDFATYRMQNLTPGVNLYELSEDIKLSELVLALQDLGTNLVNAEFYSDSLPLFTFMEYLSADYLWDKSLTLKARVYKAIALAHLGYVNESLFLLQKVTSLKDLPRVGSRKSFLTDKENIYFYPKLNYDNSEPPESNNEAIQNLLKLEVPSSLVQESSPLLHHLASYTKVLILLCIGKTENIDNSQSEQLKANLLQEAEKLCRTTLRNLSFEEEVARLVSEHTGEESLQQFLSVKGSTIEVPEVTIKDPILNSFLKAQELTSEAEQRVKRLELQCYLRKTLALIKQFQGDLTSACKVLRQALANLQSYSQGVLNVENGTEGQIKAEDKKEPPKKGNKEPAPSDPEEKNLRESKLNELLSNWEYRNLPSGLVFLSVKRDLVKTLYYQGRWEEALGYIESLKSESEQLQDSKSLRVALEVQACIMLRTGKIDSGIDLFEKVRVEAHNRKQNDMSLIAALGNYSEFLHERTHWKESLEVAKTARKLVWNLMLKNGLSVEEDYTNKDLDSKEVKIVFKRKEESKVEQGKKPPQTEAVFVEELVSPEEHNSGKVPPNIYLTHLEILVKLEIKYSVYLMQNDTNYSKTKEVFQIVLGAEKLAFRTVHLNPTLVTKILKLKAQLKRLEFLKCLYDYQGYYLAKASQRKRYRQISKKIPPYSLGSGRLLLHLPNFSQHLKEDWLPLLDQAYSYLEQAIQSSNSETILNGPHEVLKELYQVLVLQREYRPRVGYKYLPNPSEDSEEAPYEELLRTEQTKVHQITKNMVKALQCAQELFQNKVSVAEQFSQFSTAALDSNKISKCIVQDILESDYIQKKSYSPGLFDEAKKKNSATCIDFITYLVRHHHELSSLSFEKEFLEHKVNKLHKELAVNCQAYSVKCKVTWEKCEASEPEETIVPIGTMMGTWTKKRTLEGKEMMYLSYLAAPLDSEGIIKTPVEDEEQDPLEYSNKDLFLYGEVRIGEYALNRISQSFRDTKDKVKLAYKHSEDKKMRDLNRCKLEVIDELREIAYIFEPSLKEAKDDNLSLKQEKVEKSIKSFVPEINPENLDMLIEMTSQTFSFKQANINAIVRIFHSLRYS